jgi:aspartyl-tRNA(Asn)/glutamyl-tRNA(Gln) amidotransferase subunit A
MAVRTICGLRWLQFRNETEAIRFLIFPKEAAIDDWLVRTERQIRDWHGIEAPNGPARRMTEQLEETIAGHARLRRTPELNAAPRDFAHTLHTLADDPQACVAPACIPASRSDALAQTGLAGQRRRLQDRSVRSAALLAESLARIDRLDAGLNAVLWLQRDWAQRQAEAADQRRQQSQALPCLHGVPLAHKDLFGEIGRPQTAGSDFWRGHTAEVTATVMTRLTQAGSFSFAGLHMAEFAQNPTGQNASYGDCINPWNHAAISGGSSSGSGVAIAAGYCGAALGSDTGGSIRLPAACCGVTGLKPTYGLVSRTGVVPLCASLDCVGPLGRTALDCAILLDVIAGADPADPTCAPGPWRGAEVALDGDIRGQRIGVPGNWFCDQAAPEVLAAFQAALQALRDRGAVLVEIDIPLLDEITTYGGTMARVEAASLHEGWMRAAPQTYVPHVAARLYPGYAIPATYYIEAVQRRAVLLAAFVAAVFSQVDVLATPTLPSRAPSRAEADVDSDVPGTERRFFAVGGNVRPFNYLGLPALSLPVGFDTAGVPIGLQLVGRPFAEVPLLRMADAYQRDAGPPPLPKL